MPSPVCQLASSACAVDIFDHDVLLQLMGVTTATAAGVVVEGMEAGADAAAEGAVEQGIEVQCWLAQNQTACTTYMAAILSYTFALNNFQYRLRCDQSICLCAVLR